MTNEMYEQIKKALTSAQELRRQQLICAKEPDCVARAPSPWGKRINCRCRDLAEVLEQILRMFVAENYKPKEPAAEAAGAGSGAEGQVGSGQASKASQGASGGRE